MYVTKHLLLHTGGTEKYKSQPFVDHTFLQSQGYAKKSIFRRLGGPLRCLRYACQNRMDHWTPKQMILIEIMSRNISVCYFVRHAMLTPCTLHIS
jgi:hypothetical protein